MKGKDQGNMKEKKEMMTQEVKINMNQEMLIELGRLVDLDKLTLLYTIVKEFQFLSSSIS